MNTIKEVRKRILSALQAAGIDRFESEREADLIIEHTTGFSKSRQIAAGDDSISLEALSAVEKIVSERGRRFPLQYLLGEQSFMGLRFKVTPAVLIPRSDTETLVQVALEFLQTRSRPRILDIGTGSGCIAISILKQLPAASAVAVDISQQALEVAQENAAALGVRERIVFSHCAWSDYNSDEKFEALVCNPPYIPGSQAAQLQPEVGVFEPHQALFGSDADGLGFYRQLSVSAGRHLIDSGLLAVEVGVGQSAAVTAVLADAGWKHVVAHNDLNGIPRCISAQHAGEPIGRLG
jgi:release factor glutamine methyltransferase